MAKQIGTIALSNGVRYSDALIAGLSVPSQAEKGNQP